MLSNPFKGDVVDRMREAYSASNNWGYRTPIGVSKDGRPIYSPIYDND